MCHSSHLSHSREQPPFPRRAADEVEAIERAADAAWRTLGEIAAAVAPGVTTRQLDVVARDALAREGAQSLFEGYRQGSSPPFPGVLCVCIDHEVVHGIPSDRALEPGELLGIDVGLRLGGWCADLGTSLVVGGNTSHSKAPPAQALIDDTRQLLRVAIERIRPGVRWSHLATSLEQESARLGRGIVTEYVGHGIGRALHEPPKAPSYWTGFSGDDFILELGMVLALEPILTLEPGPGAPDADYPPGRVPIRIRDDGWTVETTTGTLACHEERMIIVEENGARVLAGPLQTG